MPRPPVLVSILLAGVLVWQITAGRDAADVTASIAEPIDVASPSIATTTVEPTQVMAPTASDFDVVADPAKVAEIMASRSTAPVPAATSNPDADGVVSVDAPGEHSPIRVDESIADNLAKLIAHAKADGVILGGWGWRSHDTQIRLRREHCGTSEYAIWRKPSSQCSPPTATPGNSNHESGRAIDFTVGERAIQSRNTAAWRWLDAHAGTYGFKNLPSEPWHWSVNGR